MRDHDDFPYLVIERRSAGVAPFLWGAVLGAVAGVLLAPRSGEETQRRLRDGARQVRQGAEERVAEVKGAVDRTRDAIREQVTSVRDRFEHQTEQAMGAVDTGRRVARETRDRLERRFEEARRTRPGERAAPEGEVVVTEAPGEEPLPPERLI